MTLPIHDGDIELLIAVMHGKSMVDLAREADCTSPNIRRKIVRVKARIGWKPSMTEDQVRERAKSLQLVRASCTPSTLQELITERDQLKAENERLRQIISDSATACGAAMSPECTVEFMGHLPAEIAGVLRQLRAELERVQEQQKSAGGAGAAENCRFNEKVQELQAELERARADAGRFAWLCTHAVGHPLVGLYGDELAAEIDAEMGRGGRADG